MIHVTTNNQDLFVLCVYVRAGAIYESEEHAGISHLLEHLLFRKRLAGTEALQRLEKLGGKYNGVTSKDVTYFFISTSMEHWKEACDIMSAIVTKLDITEKDLEHEVGICKEEMYRASSSEDDMDKHILPAILKGSVYEKSIIGTVKTLDAIKLADVDAFHQAHYTSCYVSASCVAGLKKRVHAHLTKVFKNPCACPTIAFDHLSLWNTNMFQCIKNTYNSMQVCYKCWPYGVRSYATLELLTYILNGGLMSIISRELREKEKVIYASSMFPMAFQGAGFLMFAATTSADVGHVYQRYLDVLQSFCTRFLTAAEFAEFKRNFMLRQKLASSDVQSQTISLGLDMYYTGEPKTWAMYNRLVSEVSIDDVRAMCLELFQRPSLTLLTSEHKPSASMKAKSWAHLQRFHKKLGKMAKHT
jgi:predicted Zn-dependent peptidase